LTLLQQKELEGLFQRFSQVCKDPTGLPTKRGREHAISLVEGQNAANVRQYRYPYHHKNEIEKQVKETLTTRII
jgi:hypothetical protein